MTCQPDLDTDCRGMSGDSRILNSVRECTIAVPKIIGVCLRRKTGGPVIPVDKDPRRSAGCKRDAMKLYSLLLSSHFLSKTVIRHTVDHVQASETVRPSVVRRGSGQERALLRMTVLMTIIMRVYTHEISNPAAVTRSRKHSLPRI
jgi:hypothetical protein